MSKSSYLLASCILLYLTVAATAQNISGHARAIDGDTLCIDDVKVRIEGIDAPEVKDRCVRNGEAYKCGSDARKVLKALVRDRQVICDVSYGDPRKRFVAVCRIDGMDIGEEVVRQGWAIDWPKYSNSKYKPAQEEAKANKRGLWADGVILPGIMIERMKSTYSPDPRPLPTRDEAACKSRGRSARKS